jgi:DNA repair exonuclease SbcCD ATPase subunit
MCRYAFKNYKSTYACFACQIGFKLPNLTDVQPELANALRKKAKQEGVPMLAQVKDATCPNCNREMYNLGRDLRLPAKTKNEQWRCIQYLYDNKYNIYSCGCSGIGFVPHKMEEAIELVKEYHKKNMDYARRVILEYNAQNREAKRKENNEVLAIKKIKQKIKK